MLVLASELKSTLTTYLISTESNVEIATTTRVEALPLYVRQRAISQLSITFMELIMALIER